jgi:hypothetical protein
MGTASMRARPLPWDPAVFTRTAVSGVHPVLGVLAPYTAPWEPGVPPSWGEYSAAGVFGLARVDGDRVQVLALFALREGAGAGGRFLAALQVAYRVVEILEVGSSVLAGMLLRRGFVPFRSGEGSDAVNGYRWTRPE